MSVAKRRERERMERRDEILDAAQRCFHKHGFEGVKMGDVAREAQLGKGTLYLYFSTKEAIVQGVAVRHQQRLLSMFEALQDEARDGLSLLRSLLLGYAEHINSPPEHLKLVMSRWATGKRFDEHFECGERMKKNVQRVFGTFQDAIRRGQEDGTIASDVDPASASLTLWAAVNGALLLQLQTHCLPARMPELFSPIPDIGVTIDFYLRAVASGPALARVSGGEG